MPISEKVKEKLREIVRIDQERLRLWERRQKLQKELKQIENGEIPDAE